MKCVIIILASVMTFSCTSRLYTDPPLNYSFMPKYLNIDSINPIGMLDTSDIVDSTLIDFKSIAIDSGLIYTESGDTILTPGYGVIISERKAALYPYYESSWERYQKESQYVKYLLKEYYNKSKSAEILYQQEIKYLQEKAERSWFENNIAYIGFASGIITMLIAQYSLVGILK